MFWNILVLFAFILVGGFGAFLMLEFAAMRSTTDEVNTLSWYIKRWRRRSNVVRSVILAGGLTGAYIWLMGHLVMEWW